MWEARVRTEPERRAHEKPKVSNNPSLSAKFFSRFELFGMWEARVRTEPERRAHEKPKVSNNPSLSAKFFNKKV
jgi:hypothetical protein